MVEHRFLGAGHRVISQKYRGVAASRALDHAEQLRRARYQPYLAAESRDIQIRHRAVRIIDDHALGPGIKGGLYGGGDVGGLHGPAKGILRLCTVDLRGAHNSRRALHIRTYVNFHRSALHLSRKPASDKSGLPTPMRSQHPSASRRSAFPMPRTPPVHSTGTFPPTASRIAAA